MLQTGEHIGIIGGGQLGRMLAMAAARLGYNTMVLDPAWDAPAFEASGRKIVAPYNDKEALKTLAEKCAVITYEFENVDLSAFQAIEKLTTCHPNSNALATSQDRLVEKSFFREVGAATADFHVVGNAEELNHALKQCGGNGILKTRRFGYDGKGQIRIRDFDENAIADAVSMIEKSASILERFIDFEREVSIISARSPAGDTEFFDLAENVHKNGILSTSTLPAATNTGVFSDAKRIAENVMQKLDYVGVLAIEFFVTKDGNLLVNEFAPRVHNSGHWTEAACTVSQFEQHIRAITGAPLGATTRHSDCIMENLIGNDIEKAGEILKQPDTMLHLYGKAEAREGRKMGHFTRIMPK